MSRPCIIVCNFNDKEAKLLKTYGTMMGIKDQIRVNWTNGDTLVKDILEDNISSGCEEEIRDRAIIFNDLPNMKVSMFIDNMKKMRISPAVKAIVTETSINWSLSRLLKNLIEERKAERLGKEVNHSEE